MKINALVAHDAAQPLTSGQVSLRALQKQDVKIEILFCGVCHSDLHMARNEWAVSQYPLVPGHEIVGRVVDVGDEATRFKPGDIVGVGLMVDSCRECHFCKHHEEQYCEAGFTATYNGMDKYTGERTRGGYAQSVIVDQDFVVSVPQNLPLAGVAPLLCAGVTVWSLPSPTHLLRRVNGLAYPDRLPSARWPVPPPRSGSPSRAHPACRERYAG